LLLLPSCCDSSPSFICLRFSFISVIHSFIRSYISYRWHSPLVSLFYDFWNLISLCLMLQLEDKYPYDCDIVDLFEIGHMHNQEYLVNIRMPPNAITGHNMDIGELSAVHLVVSRPHYWLSQHTRWPDPNSAGQTLHDNCCFIDRPMLSKMFVSLKIQHPRPLQQTMVAFDKIPVKLFCCKNLGS